jgi:hypothetical protein
MKFSTELVQGETKNVVGIEVPAAIVEGFGAGKRPPVRVTINGYSYRSTVAVMGGRFMISLSAEHRDKAGVQGGQTVEVTLDLDASPRVVEIPADLGQALQAAGVQDAFDRLAPSQRKEHVRAINDAKTDETRTRRIAKVVERLAVT